MRKTTGGQRLLQLRDILFTETDETHEPPMEGLIEMLREHFGKEFEFDHRAIRRGFSGRNENGKKKCIKFMKRDRKKTISF